MPSQTVHFVSVKVFIANCRRDNCSSAHIFATREWHGETGAVSGGGTTGPTPPARARLSYFPHTEVWLLWLLLMSVLLT